MPSNWEPIVNGVLYVALTGAMLKYLFWDFFRLSAIIDRDYQERVNDATEKVGAERFVPRLVEIIETVERRKSLQVFSRGTTSEFLMELDLASKQLEIKAAAVGEYRIKKLFRAYKRSCMPVALASLFLWLGDYCALGRVRVRARQFCLLS